MADIICGQPHILYEIMKYKMDVSRVVLLQKKHCKSWECCECEGKGVCCLSAAINHGDERIK